MAFSYLICSSLHASTFVAFLCYTLLHNVVVQVIIKHFVVECGVVVCKMCYKLDCKLF